MFVVLSLLVVVSVSVMEASHNRYGCSHVVCSDYQFKVKPSNGSFKECRFKMRPYNQNVNKTGVHIHKYADSTKIKKTDFFKPTEECRKSLLMTESPRDEDLDYLFTDRRYRECCAFKVVDQCYYRVVLYMKCASVKRRNRFRKKREGDEIDRVGDEIDRVDDEIDRVEVLYRNQAKNKRVKAVFIPNKSLSCQNDFHGEEKLKVRKVRKNKLTTKQCGDHHDLDVRIESSKNADNSIMLRIVRVDCNNQSVAMFTDPSLREKFTMHTIVSPDKETGYVGLDQGRTAIAPVLAKTRNGACGKIAESDNVLPGAVFDP